MASTKITRTFGSGNQDKWTFSVWLKRAKTGTTQKFFNCKVSGANYQYLSFNGSDGISYYNHYSSASHGELVTSKLFLDRTAWYHIVFVYDSGNATSADRTKLYVNGVRETAFSSESQPAQNQNGIINSANVHDIGSNQSAQYFDGCMSHVNFCDGQAYAASDFGETDSTSGIWKIKTSPSVTYGTNGFFLKMEDKTNLDLDSSGNSHTFATTGNLISTKDNPSNNLCTNNWLMPTVDTTADSIANIGNTALMQTSTYKAVYGTLGVSTGKWYTEIKLRTDSGTGSTSYVGVINADKSPYFNQDDTNFEIGGEANGVAYVRNGGFDHNASTPVSGQATYTSGDILQIALDVDNGFIYFGKNNAWQNSGVPTSGSTGTGGYAISNIGTGGTYFMGFGGKSGNSAPYWDVNWGNGAFANADIGTVYADSAGEGAFKYTPPTNFLTICTKNIKTNG
tara:strand:+ start:207 stop:1565 length:1359 start_codon:yes stop_codon:yes gene_type:complete